MVRVVSLLTSPAIFPYIYPLDYHPTKQTLKMVTLYKFLLELPPQTFFLNGVKFTLSKIRLMFSESKQNPVSVCLFATYSYIKYYRK